MRHQKHHQGLGITREHRKALLANLAVALLNHGRIETTLPKAKALRPFVEKVITKAKKAAKKTEKKDAIHLRRLAIADIRDETTVTNLFNAGYKEFENRPGGYTRIYKLGQRIGDAAEIALIELVKANDVGYQKRGKKAKQEPKVAPAPAAAAPAPAAEAAAPAATPAPEAAK